MSQKRIDPDKRLAAVCGLFCPSCMVYIATHEDPERLKKIADTFQTSEDAVRCYGCRSEKRLPYCDSCKMVACAAEKGIDFCGACEEFPCEALKTFQAARPHRIELWENQKRIQEAGYAQWFEEMVEHYTCPKCQTLNSAYDVTCRECGSKPSCEYVGMHLRELEAGTKRSG